MPAFKETWLLPSSEYSSWVQRVKDSDSPAYCELCNVYINISHNGAYSLTSHAKGKGHKTAMRERMSVRPITSFWPQLGGTSNAAAGTSAEVGQPVAVYHMRGRAVIREEVLHAEIYWALRETQHHHSMNSNEDAVAILRKMVSESLILQDPHFSMSPAKLANMVAYGIYPYVLKKLAKKLNAAECFVACVDESFNPKLGWKQLDVVVRYWDPEADGGRGQIETTYFNSKFLGHARAEHLLENFTQALGALKIEKLLQIGMDGPHTNLKFRRLFDENHREERKRGLLDIGTCPLHTLHNAFKVGCKATTWNMEEHMSAFYRLFVNSSASREDFEDVTADDVYPAKFTGTRWLENKSAAQRIVQLLPKFKSYIDALIKRNAEPNGADSYISVKSAAKDLLFEAKLEFFISVAADIEPFLRAYQGAAPMAPFLFEDLVRVLRRLLGRFVSTVDAIHDDDSAVVRQLHELDFTNYAVFKPTTDLGTAARECLDKLSTNPLVANKLGPFRFECRKFLITVIDKICERSPLARETAARKLPCGLTSTYRLVRGLSSLSPTVIGGGTSSNKMKERFGVCVQELHQSRALSSADADEAKHQYAELLARGVGSFARSQQRLDHYWRSQIGSDDNFVVLWRVFRMLLSLSHGQASVEGGFSVNDELLKDNMGELRVVSQRLVCEWINRSGGAENCVIDDDLRMCVKRSSTDYKNALDAKKTAAQQEQKDAERKRKSAAAELQEAKEMLKKAKADEREKVKLAEAKVKDMQSRFARLH